MLAFQQDRALDWAQLRAERHSDGGPFVRVRGWNSFKIFANVCELHHLSRRTAVTKLGNRLGGKGIFLCRPWHFYPERIGILNVERLFGEALSDVCGPHGSLLILWDALDEER